MDDAPSPWLRLALCPQTPNALIRELLCTSECTPTQLSLSLNSWLSPDTEQPPPPLEGAGAVQATTGAWRALSSQLHTSDVDAAIEKTLNWQAGAANRFIITPDHPAWPSQLSYLQEPPAALYVIGEPALLRADQVAMVGARRSSMDAQVTASNMATELARLGWVITSGLALGIDTEAHRGCLAGGAPTLSVMATDPTQCYPKANRALAGEILAKGGCLITETPLGMPLERYRFPRRNRLIAGLSRGVVVVEAAVKSGTITTAQHAAAQGREVMAVPGSVRNPRVSGCHQLIRDGAVLVTSAADVVECLGECGNDRVSQIRRESPDMTPSRVIDELNVVAANRSSSKQVATLLDAMGYDAAPLERLVQHTGMAATELVTLLTQLELQGRVTRDLAGRYSRC